MEVLKVVLVGDVVCRKTDLLTNYKKEVAPPDYAPSAFDDHTAVVVLDGKKVTVSLVDTAGQEDYARLRPLSYPDTDVFIFIFSISNTPSFEHVKSLWYPEVKKQCPSAPIVLAGIDPKVKGIKTLKRTITKDDAEKLARELNAVKFMECHLLKADTIKGLFEEAIRAGTIYKAKKSEPSTPGGGKEQKEKKALGKLFKKKNKDNDKEEEDDEDTDHKEKVNTLERKKSPLKLFQKKEKKDENSSSSSPTSSSSTSDSSPTQLPASTSFFGRKSKDGHEMGPSLSLFKKKTLKSPPPGSGSPTSAPPAYDSTIPDTSTGKKGVLTQSQWEEVLHEAQQEDEVKEIAGKLVKEKIQIQDLADLNAEEFTQLGIKAIGVRKALQRISRERSKVKH